MQGIGLVVRSGIWGVILCTPLLGFWLASSLAAYLNGPLWAAAAAGLLLFPVGPLLWELWAARRRRRRLARQQRRSYLDALSARKRSARVTTLPDRLLLRTLALNVPFLVGIGTLAPGAALDAVATRGDWMVEDVDQPWAQTTARAIRALGDGLQRFNQAFEDNPWASLAEVDTDRIPEAHELEAIEVPEPPPPAPAPPPTVSPILIVPRGATLQVHDRILTEDAEVELLQGEPVQISLTFADRRRLSCTVTPGPALELALQEDEAGPTFGAGPCQQLRAADPGWRPELRLEGRRIGDWLGEQIERRGIAPERAPQQLRARGLLRPGEVLAQAVDGSWVVLGPVVVGPDAVAHVHRATPYLRLELTDEGREAFCAATTDAAGRRFGVLVDGQLRFVQLINEAHCTGFVPLQTGDRAVQHDWEADQQPDAGAATTTWPASDEPHPLAEALPELDSIEALGEHIAAHTSGQAEAARLIHDWIALNVAYDVASLEPGQRKPQDADTVFRSHVGVCAGYANLFVALASAAGLDAAYVTGNVRDHDGELTSGSHAWNAVKLDGRWALLDVTWDAGIVGGDGFEARYKSAYLFTPPEIFRSNHLPEHDAWQLHPDPIGRGEFIRQPNLSPAFFAAGLTLISPDRAQVDAHEQIEVQIDNPGGRSITASLGETRCAVDGDRRVTVRCAVPRRGRHELVLFEAARGAARHWSVGRILVNSR